jgi:signal transduction histidine kinase
MIRRKTVDGVGRSLRGRVQAAIVAVTGAAVLLFAIPLGIAVQHVYRSQMVTSLQRDATRITTVVPDTIAVDGGTVRLPADLPSGLIIGIYTPDGRRIQGSGPDRSAVALAARDGRLHETVEAGGLAVSAPVSSDQTVAAVVRVESGYAAVTDRVWRTWLAMAVLAALILALAAVMAGRLAARVAAPLERLTGTAKALGAGDFSIRARRSGIREADAVAAALDSTAERLGVLLDRERAFSTRVSHQLRTPLTALLLGLESALSRPDADLAAAVRTALRRAEHLETTIEDLLSLSRHAHSGAQPLDVPALLAGVHDRWDGTFAERGRDLVVTAEPDVPTARASAAAVRQIVDVLVGNTLAHGAGQTRVTISDLGAGVAVTVSDDGPGLAGDPETAFAPRHGQADHHGIGLGLARSLAEAEGGRLLVRRAAPQPMFSLLLPLADAPDAESPDAESPDAPAPAVPAARG